jgi:hypothetical protein
VTDEVEAANAEPFFFKSTAQLVDEFRDIAGDGLRGTDRFGKATTDFNPIRRTDRDDGLAQPSNGLIEPATGFRPEA